MDFLFLVSLFAIGLRKQNVKVMENYYRIVFEKKKKRFDQEVEGFFFFFFFK